MILLSTVYLGNLQYYSKLISGRRVVIDICESFMKQSYRSRTEIMAANGPVVMSVPVLRPHGVKVATRDVEIDYSKQWQPSHWHSLVSAYKKSPYFDEYAPEFEPFYHRKIKNLVELNDELQRTVYNILGLEPNWEYSTRYYEQGEVERDFRNSISTKPRLKRDDPEFEQVEYYQSFCEKNPFEGNLSIVDLLFAEGADATLEILRESIK